MGGASAPVKAFVDSNILVRHLSGEPSDQAARVTAFLRDAEQLLLVDLVVAEVVYVLESVYQVERERVSELMHAVLGFPAIAVVDAPLLLRALELYEVHRLHFADAYLSACAEASGLGVVASFDRAIDRVGTIKRLEPGA
jgi:predicted nucleic acid-binding protein